MKLLLIEDEKKLLEILSERFKQQGALIDLAENGEQALIALSQSTYDVVILDLGLPKLSGIEVLKQLRTCGLNQTTPVLILSARNSWQERVQGLQTGADDYLGKPFEFDELHARLLALYRRVQSQGLNRQLLQFCEIKLYLESKSVQTQDATYVLTKTEFRLLEYLMRHPHQILSKTQLMDRIRDQNQHQDSNLIEVYIRKLRKKIGNQAIETHRGLGYQLICPNTKVAHEKSI